MLKIGLIDNFPIARKGLGLLLEGYFYGVQTWDAQNTAEMQQVLGDQAPDVIILGNNVKRKPHLTPEVVLCVEAFPSTAIIVLDGTYQPGNSAFYLRSGVMGHLLKECPVSELINCIESVRKNKYFLSSKLHSMVVEEMTDSNPVKPIATPMVVRNSTLTPKELQIAFYLYQGKGTSYIAKVLQKAPSNISGAKRRIFQKMKLDNVPDLASLIDRHNFEHSA